MSVKRLFFGQPKLGGSVVRRWMSKCRSRMCRKADCLIENTSGFTLVELLVAVTILSIGLLGIMSAIAAAQDTQARAIHMAIARDVAIKRIEIYRSNTSGGVYSWQAPFTSPDLPKGNKFTPTSAKYPDSTSSMLWRVAVTVVWPEGKGTQRKVYETLLYKPLH